MQLLCFKGNTAPESQGPFFIQRFGRALLDTTAHLGELLVHLRAWLSMTCSRTVQLLLKIQCKQVNCFTACSKAVANTSEHLSWWSQSTASEDSLVLSPCQQVLL